MARSPRGTALAAVVTGLLLAAACGGSSGERAGEGGASSSSAPGGPATSLAEGAAEPGPDEAGAALAARPRDDCPAGYDGDEAPAAGENSGFASSGQQRSFHLVLPDDLGAEPRPLFVALTGTVQSEEAFLEQSQLDRLADDGWIVVAPVRNGNGLVWGPWDAMRTPAQADLPNPDAAFIVELVRCLAAHHPVDASRVFVGGISIGGTMTNLLLRAHSDLFAGGIVGSGNFILTEPPEPEPLEPMTVIVAWGGDGDRWVGCADGRMGEELADEPGCVDVSFVADAASASQFYAAEAEVAQVACQADVGHIWISAGTAVMADMLRARPKGSTTPVAVPDPLPDGLRCSTGAFTG